MIWGIAADYLLYGVTLGLSLLLTLAGIVSGYDFDLDVDVDINADVDLQPGSPIGAEGLPLYNPLNPIALLAFLGGFGATGFIARGLGMSTALAMLIALFWGLAISALAFRVFARLILASEARGAHATTEAVGKLATVTVSIPAGGLGAVSYIADGRRQTIPARPQLAQPIGRGTEVVIVELAQHIATVKPFARQ